MINRCYRCCHMNYAFIDLTPAFQLTFNWSNVPHAELQRMSYLVKGTICTQGAFYCKSAGLGLADMTLVAKGHPFFMPLRHWKCPDDIETTKSAENGKSQSKRHANRTSGYRVKGKRRQADARSWVGAVATVKHIVVALGFVGRSENFVLFW